MKSLDEYITEKLRDGKLHIHKQLSIGYQGNELYSYFDGDIPKYLEEMFVSGHTLEEVLLEHLKNIDSKYILKDLQEYFEWCYDIYEDKEHELILLEAKHNPKKDKDFLKLIDIYQYNIKKCFPHMNGTYSVTLDKNFPEDVTSKVNKDNRYRYVFHVTSRNAAENILENGLRPGFHYDNPKNVRKQVWKDYKESHDKNKWNKTYFFYVPQFYMNNESLKKVKEIAQEVDKTVSRTDDAVLLCVHLPEETRVYADKSMPMDNCCFTYAKIPAENIYEIKNTFNKTK